MYDNSFWDERYNTENYVYGKEPNAFLKENVDRIGGAVLSLCEGEGRNAVFLAERGLKVLGVDCSAVALEKAKLLADARQVTIELKHADLGDFDLLEDSFDSVISIFAHLPGELRAQLYPRIEKSLRPGGVFLMEAYSEKQLNFNTGGPKSLEMLMSIDKVKSEFPGLEPLQLIEIEREVIEGEAHNGVASVIQFIGRKK